MRYKLHPDYHDKKEFLLQIKKHFQASNTSIHKARNEIKIVDGFVVKAFKVPHIINRFAYAYVRDSKAKKSYENALKIPKFTPKPLGYIEFFKQGLLHESYAISEKSAYDFTIKAPLDDANFPDRESIFKALAHFSYELHQEGILHKDYSPGNILIKETKEGYHFNIVDINRMVFAPLSIQQRMQNFAKLGATDEDLACIIQHYAPLLNEAFQPLFDQASSFTKAHQSKRQRKKHLKKALS